MKNTLLAIFVLSALGIKAQTVNQTITSVNNGNASNPLTWDCICFPTPSDNVIINTAVTLDVDWSSNGALTVNAGKSFNGNSASRILNINGGSFTNNGTTSIAFIYHSGGTFTNNSVLNVTESFGNTASVTTTNNSSMNVTDSMYIAGTMLNNNSLSSYGTAVSGTFNNYGGFTTGDLWNSGSFTNYAYPGLIITHDIYSSGTITNHTNVTVANDFWNSENVINNAYIVIDNSLYTGDSVQLTANFTNNGLVSVAADMLSNQTVTGSGDFCVGATTANSGTISGTLDICDLTGGSLDLNTGTVAGTVTFCSSPCALGVEEAENEEPVVSVYPNPFNNKLTIRLDGMDQAQFILQNLLGQKLIDKTVSGKTELTVDDFDSGVYFYTVIVNEKIFSSGKLLKE